MESLNCLERVKLPGKPSSACKIVKELSIPNPEQLFPPLGCADLIFSC
jgi:hypothetical protein